MATHDNNPYARALEGLRLEDPVKAFFDFSPAEGSVTYAENTVSTRK